MGDDRLIVASLVEGSEHFPVYGRVQAWDVDSLPEALRQQRYRMAEQFMPVAVFVADPDLLVARYGWAGLPQSLWLHNFAQVFRRAVIAPEFQRAVFSHYQLLDGEGSVLGAVWELATRFRDVT